MYDQFILPVLIYFSLITQKNTTPQVAQRTMEHCILGITRRDQKIIEWISQRTQVIDVVRRVKPQGQ